MNKVFIQMAVEVSSSTSNASSSGGATMVSSRAVKQQPQQQHLLTKKETSAVIHVFLFASRTLQEGAVPRRTLRGAPTELLLQVVRQLADMSCCCRSRDRDAYNEWTAMTPILD
jgi:hypothetical protein